jgi:hypothetical protein
LRRQEPSGPTIEERLEALQDEAKEYPARLKQLAAVRFYLQVMLAECQLAWEALAKGITNYKVLLDDIEHWRGEDGRVCLVTFNYDTMLENALPVVGIRLRMIDDYVASKSYKIVKVHGSVDWAHDVEAGLDISGKLSHLEAANWLIEKTVASQVRPSYRRIPFGHFGIDSTGRPRVPIVPALAVPFQTKRDFACPEPHLAVLRDIIPAVTKVLIIGWRAKDHHFLELLGNLKAPHIAIVSGDRQSAEEVRDSLVKFGIRIGLYALFVGGFSHFVTSGEATKFLQPLRP